MFSVAKQRLLETIHEHRAKLEAVAAVAIGKMTVGDAARVYLEKVRANVSLKPRSKDYRDGLIDFINRSWPALFGTDVRKVTERDCQEWLVRFQKLYAPSVVNNAIGTLRAVFAEAVDRSARLRKSSGESLTRTDSAKRLVLPSREEFLRFVEEIRTAGARQSKDCANLVRFLAYSGLRIGEAKFVTWADANFARPSASCPW